MGRREARRIFNAIWSAREKRLDRHNARERNVTLGYAWLAGRNEPSMADYHEAVAQMAAERETVMRVAI